METATTFPEYKGYSSRRGKEREREGGREGGMEVGREREEGR